MIQLKLQNPRNRPSEESVSAFMPKVYRLAKRMLGSDADAEDVTQEVLLAALRKLPTFRGESSLGTWIYRITINAVLGFRRRQANRPDHTSVSEWETERVQSLPRSHSLTLSRRTPAAVLEERETKQLIDRAIATLPEKYRRVYLLADVENLANAEIAKRLGLSVPAVKSQLHRARAMMRTALASHFECSRH